MKTLTDFIDETWQQLKEATKNEDWAATEQAFSKMQKLQQINAESSRNLLELIPGLSHESTIADQPRSNPITSVSHLYGGRRPTTRPKELRIGPDKITISLNNQILVATANWILKKGKRLPTIQNFIHPTKSGFSESAQTKQLDDGSFIEIGDDQGRLVQKARDLLFKCGFRAEKLEVTLEDDRVL